MRCIHRLFLIMFLIGSIACAQLIIAHAAVPHLINYQGRLTNPAGQPLDGTYNLTFRIYDAEAAGNLLWEETYASLLIQKGIFNILLGSVTNLNLTFDKPYWLEIKVGADTPMTPRQQITSAGYAIRAGDVDILPRGSIILWYGSVASIPSGWALCDGANGTPDLRDKFIIGARQDDTGIAKTNVTGALTQAGGTVTHQHTGSTGSDASGDYRGWNAAPGPSGWNGDASRGWHTHSYSSSSSSSLPPYYALAYIMKN